MSKFYIQVVCNIIFQSDMGVIYMGFLGSYARV